METPSKLYVIPTPVWLDLVIPGLTKREKDRITRRIEDLRKQGVVCE